MKVNFSKILLLAASLIFSASLALADTLVATGAAIVKVSGGQSETLVAQPANSMFYDEESEKIYFATTSGIFRMDSDGSNLTTLIADVGNTIGGLVVDTSHERIIWTEPGQTRLRSSNLSGGDVQDFYLGTSLPHGIAISKNTGRVYWTSGVGSIETTDLSGNNWDEVVFDFDLPSLRGLVVVGDTIYFADSTAGTLRSIKTNGTDDNILVSGLTSIRDVSYDASENRLQFVGENAATRLSSVNLDGSGKTQISTTQGVGLIAGVSSDVLYVPDEPPAEPTTEPAPEIRPPYTLMYMSIQNKAQPEMSRVVATNYYRESEVVRNFLNPRAIGYSKAQNSLFVVDKVAPDASYFYRMNTDGENLESLVFSPYHYESILVDDAKQRIYLGQAEDDFGEYRKATGVLTRLYNRTGENARGFGFLGEHVLFSNKSQLLRRKRSGGAVSTWFSHATNTRAVGATDEGLLTLERDTDEDMIWTYAEGTQPISLYGWGVYLGKRGYRYEHMAVQHLDPETFDYPSVLYLASGNKVDVLVFLPHPVILPFMRLDENEVVTGIVEVPLDGSVEYNDPVAPGTIKGSVNFVSFNTGPSALGNSAAGIHVHLTLENSLSQLSEERLNQSARKTLTDAQGRYFFDNLVEGATYRIRFSRGDLRFSGSGVKVRSGSHAPTIFASEVEKEEFGCNKTVQNRALTRADRLNSKIVSFAVNRSSRRFERARPRQKARMQNITARLNARHEALLASSEELPSVRLQCVKSSPCTVSNARQAARAYKRDTRRIANIAERLMNVSFNGASNQETLLVRLNRMSKNAARLSQRIQSRTFVCPDQPGFLEQQ